MIVHGSTTHSITGEHILRGTTLLQPLHADCPWSASSAFESTISCQGMYDRRHEKSMHHNRSI